MATKDFPAQLDGLYSQLLKKVEKYKALDEKDIRLKHLQILAAEVLFGLYSLKINTDFAEKLSADFANIFDNDKEQIENYAYWHNHNINNNLFGTFIFQSELLFRVYQSILNGGTPTPGGEKNLHKIFSSLLDDVENNEQKEETKLLLLVWKLRNTIHTSGIYLDKPEGFSVKYKGQVYVFEYGKAPAFLKDGFLMDLLSDLIEVLEIIFDKQKIIDIGLVEHPSYLALDK